MRRRVLSIGATDVYLHAATVLFGLYMVLTGYGALLFCGFFSIILHEGAHALTSAALGFPPQEVEITPLGCLMRQEAEERMPFVKRLLMLLAGPAMTLLLCVLAVLLSMNGFMSRPAGRMLFTCNAAILCVNALPALPLDGGRVAALLLGCFLRGETVRRIMRGMGAVLGAALIGLNVAVCIRFGGWNLSMACAGCFLLYAAACCTTPAALAELQMLMERKARLENRGFQRTCMITVTDALPLQRAVRLLHPSKRTFFLVQRLGSMALLARITEDELVSAYLRSPGEKCRIFGQSDN